ncbi:Hsp70 family protein [Rhodococcus triatomae]
MADRWILGIDFGTSNTAAAHTNATSGAVEAVQLSHNRTTMSSSVFVESPDHIDVGDVASNRAESNPAAFMPMPKRYIGQGVVTLNGYSIPTSVPVAAVLRSVLDRATAAHAGQPPSQLILTHPEAWSPREIQILLDAAISLGLAPGQITTVSEPRAAAHYYSRSTPLPVGAQIAVFDFGGGTLDIAVLEADPAGGFTVVSARGDNGIGGKNFDALLRRWVDDQLEATNPDLLDYLRSAAPVNVRQALDESIRTAKELLSETPSATITAAGGGFHETLQITRDEFEEIITPALDKAMALTRATLGAAGIGDPGRLTALYLTGGSSRIPVVHERLKDLGPIATLDDPKTVVVQGAVAANSAMVGAGAGATTGPAGGRYSHQSTAVPSAWPSGAAEPSAPEAAGNNYRWQPTASESTAAQPSPGFLGSTRNRLVAAGAAIVVAAAAFGGYVVLNDNSGAATAPDREATAAGADTAASGGGPASKSSGEIPTVDDTIAALPPSLRNELDPEECDDKGETMSGRGRQVQCTIRQDSALIDGLFPDDDSTTWHFVSFNVDVDDAKKEVTDARKGGGYLGSDRERKVVEDAARQATGTIEGYKPGNSEGFDPSYTLQYSNYVTGLNVFLNDLPSIESGTTFLSRAGLIS